MYQTYEQVVLGKKKRKRKEKKGKGVSLAAGSTDGGRGGRCHWLMGGGADNSSEVKTALDLPKGRAESRDVGTCEFAIR